MYAVSGTSSLWAAWPVSWVASIGGSAIQLPGSHVVLGLVCAVVTFLRDLLERIGIVHDLLVLLVADQTRPPVVVDVTVHVAADAVHPVVTHLHFLYFRIAIL